MRDDAIQWLLVERTRLGVGEELRVAYGRTLGVPCSDRLADDTVCSRKKLSRCEAECQQARWVEVGA